MKSLAELMGVQNVLPQETVDNPLSSIGTDLVSDSDFSVQVIFTLLNNGNVDIEYNWVEDKSDIAGILGEMLYHINVGTFQQHCLTALHKYGTADIRNQQFIAMVIKMWQNINTKFKNQPIVKPSEVFQHITPSPVQQG